MSETVKTSEVSLCLDHLRHEEALLKTALAMVAAIKDVFAQPGLEAFAAALGGHRDFVKLMEDLQRRRRQFSETMGRHLGLSSSGITLSAIMARLPDERAQAVVAEATDHVRRLAHELAAANFVISVHVRVHLDAYRRILRDLTNTKGGSGRYGPAGRPESLDYRPMLQIHG